jgi:hypothetical protein
MRMGDGQASASVGMGHLVSKDTLNDDVSLLARFLGETENKISDLSVNRIIARSDHHFQICPSS